MIIKSLDISTTCHQVGCASVSQFSREYSTQLN